MKRLNFRDVHWVYCEFCLWLWEWVPWIAHSGKEVLRVIGDVCHWKEVWWWLSSPSLLQGCMASWAPPNPWLGGSMVIEELN